MFCAASFKNLWCESGYIPLKDEKRCRELIILIKEESIDTGSDYNRLFHLHVVSSRLRTTSTLGSRGYFFLIDTDGWRRSCVNEEKKKKFFSLLIVYATSPPTISIDKKKKYPLEPRVHCQQTFQQKPLQACFSQSLSRISSSSPKTFEAVPYAVKPCVLTTNRCPRNERSINKECNCSAAIL